MRIVRRILFGLGVLIMVAAFGLTTWEPLFAARAAPPPAHPYDVTITRDTFGVPHIFGKTDPDVAYGIAYAHAEDDFSTLQEVLAMTRGRLGAITGQDGAKTDFVVHLLGARATVARDYMQQPADVRALLDGYASGLNRYAETHPDEVRLARLFPANGEDIATGFVVRSPFFFGLEGVLGALTGDKPLPVESAGAPPGAPAVTPLGVRLQRLRRRARALGGRLHPPRLQFAPALARRRGVVRARRPFADRMGFRWRAPPRRALSADGAQQDAWLDQHRQPPRPD